MTLDQSAAQPFLQLPLVRDLLIPLLVFAIFYTLSRPLTGAFFALMRRIGRKAPGGGAEAPFDDAFRRPARTLLVGIGLFAALGACPAVTGTAGLWPLIEKCFRSFFVILLAWGLSRLAGGFQASDSQLARRINLPEDRTVLKALVTVARFLIYALAVLIVAQEWDFSISGLIAGLGLGGLAFALAAKDMLTNLFGGLVILLDKPFAIGDKIKTGDVEGTVEDINFRSLKIRTESQALVTVPNGTVTAGPITNYSRMEKRKLTFQVALAADAAEKDVAGCTERIRAALRQDDGIEDGTFAVSADLLGSGGPTLTVSCYAKATDRQGYLGTKERLSAAVLQILTGEGLK